MEEEPREFHYTTGIYDTICKFIREKVRENSEHEGAYGIGVYSDDICEEKFMTHPLKSTEQRMTIAAGLDGVDFVFAVDDLTQIQEAAERAYLKYKQRVEEIKRKRQYKAGFIIGSFDMFHSGHLENIELARQYCDRLFVVLKTDERIIKNKRKVPQQSTAERAAILRSLRQIEDVLYMDIDTTRSDVIEDIVRVCGRNIDRNDIVAIFGSDLREKETPHIKDEWKEINVLFTERDPQRMETVSSSHYQREVMANGGIHRFENIEEEAYREN